MKVLGSIVLLLVLLVGGAAAYLYFNTGSLIKTGIEELGPDYLGVDVSVDEVNLELAEGTAQVKGLSVGNPAGYEGDQMMSLNEVMVALDTAASSESLIVMKRVLIDGADVAAVAKGQKTNFQQLLDNLSSGSDTGGDSSEASSDAGPKFIIDDFSFTNATASLNSDVLGEMSLNLPDINLQGVGRKSNGATAAEISEQLLKPISAAISKEAVNQGLDLDGVKANVEDKIRDKLGSGLRGLTDKLN